MANITSASRLVHSTSTPNPLALKLVQRKRVTYALCRHCGYEKVAGEPCGLPCV